METSYEQDQKDGTEPICSDSGALLQRAQDR